MIMKRIRDGSKTADTFADEKFVLDPRYRIVKLLGKGTYGTVVSAVDTKGHGENGIPVAIKKVTRMWNHEVLLLRTIREVKLMKHFRGHRNVSIFRGGGHPVRAWVLPQFPSYASNPGR